MKKKKAIKLAKIILYSMEHIADGCAPYEDYAFTYGIATNWDVMVGVGNNGKLTCGLCPVDVKTKETMHDKRIDITLDYKEGVFFK